MNEIKRLKLKKLDIISVVSQNSKKRLKVSVGLTVIEIGIDAEIIDGAKLSREK
ncbi:MAG TPA: hypothetical protein VF047_02285 [Nitrososphaeraceae archaeon]